MAAEWMKPPLPNVFPSRGKGPFFTGVIASPAKQPRGLTLTCGDVPLGCFGVLRLAMTRVKQDPLPRPRRYFPQRGKILGRHIFPLWGKWPEGP